MASEAAGASSEATKAVLDLSLKMGESTASIKIDNVWLAAGLSAAALTLGAFYIHRKYPAQRAIRNALEIEEAGVVDPEVRGIEEGSILVDLVFHTEQTFLSFMDDFEAKKIKLRLEDEFRKIRYEEKLEVTITNLDEVYQKLNDIRGYAGSQGKDVQPMKLDEDSYQTAPCPKQGRYFVDNSSRSKGDLPDILDIKIEEDSNQEPRAKMMKRTNEKSRYFAENVLCCTVAIAPDAASQQKKEKKKKKKELGLDHKDAETPQDLILKNACALLNSGGGILVIKSVDSQRLSQDMVDNFWKTIEPKLKGLLKSSLTYNEVFVLKEDFDEIFLFISAPQHLCTIEYNLFVPGDGGVFEANYDQTVKLLQKETAQGTRRKSSGVDVTLKNLPKVPRTLRCKEKLRLTESKQVQFKHFRSETYLDSNNRTQCQNISKQISAFANASGGVILLGITDKREVCGLKVNEKNSKENIEERVIAIVEKMSRGGNFTLQREVHWDMEFIPVSDFEPNVVVVIYVAGMASSGGVFIKCPKSFELRSGDDERKVPCLLNFEEWKKGMLNDLELQSNSKAIKAVISKFDVLSISKGRLLTVKSNVNEIRDAFFAVTDRFPVTPRGFGSNLPPEAQDVIKEVQRRCSRGRNRGLILASHSRPNNSEVRPIRGVICDLLIVSRHLGGLHLLTLCHGDEKFLEYSRELLEYSREVAQTIKTRLVRDGACIQKFYVTPHVVPCTGTKTELAFLRDNRYPLSYDLDVSRNKLSKILEALVIVLATVPSALSNKLGVNIMNLLTKEQFQLVHEQIEINRELFIKGAAGTGKTLVAVEFMRELKRREKLENEEILCVCENSGIRNEIRAQDVCEVVCRRTFEYSQFPKVRHVVVDEAHNYGVSPSFGTEVPLYQKARHLVRQHDPNRAGYLWIFSHNVPSGLPHVTQQRRQFRLKKVIRNSRKIFDFAKRFLTEDEVVGTLETGHDFDGEVVTFIQYSKKEKSQLDVVVNGTIKSLLSEGYESKDIAILFNNESCFLTDLKAYPCPIGTAAENHTDFLVVSTVLKYSGLERPVVILVDIMDRIPFERRRNPFIYHAVTRAMIKLIIIQGI